MNKDAKSIIVEDYAQSLTELTFNSRPIIYNLTIIARENTEVADGILKAITNRIYKCIPDQKLFALYLLDSICKTVGDPYNTLVGDEVFNIFSHVYLLVNNTIRQKLVNLFESWKTFKIKGTNLPLFPQDQIDRISSFLSQANVKTGTNPAQLTNRSLIDDIDTLIPIFQKKMYEKPDPKLTDKYNALTQLKVLLSNQAMKLNELQAVQSQLNAIKQQELNSKKNMSPSMALLTINPIPSEAKPNNKVNELFGMLVVSGLIHVDQSLKPGSLPTYRLNFPKRKYHSTMNIPNNVALPSNSVLEQLLVSTHAKFNVSGKSIARTEYEQLKFNELNRLSIDSTGLQNFVNSNAASASEKSLLYEAKPSKCGTCGKRFTDDEDGTQKRRMHLDWHFRVNKKLSTSNVQSRIWYLDDYEWVKFKEASLSEYSTADPVDSNNPVETVEEQKEIPFVPVPMNETNMNNKCLICRDQVKATYNDDLGEWCWYNCIRAPGEGKNSRKIVHATCFSEANRKRGADDDLTNVVKREKL